ncbi:MAG: hypothetical protein M1822_007458 [Bathelium mastoideum]|nr:MAG: hypothetical protein M1822_007458 [Bathelium mastoideum]
MLLYEEGFNYLLDSRIKLPNSLYLLSKLTTELKGSGLLEILFNDIFHCPTDEDSFTERLTRKLDSDLTVDPWVIESRAERETAVSSMSREPYMMAGQLISAMEFYGITSWRDIFHYVFHEILFAFEDNAAALKLVIKMWRWACPNKRMKGTFELVLRDLVKYEFSVGAEVVDCVLEVFIQQNWCINWTKICKPGDSDPGLDLSVIKKLTEAGLPYSKSMLLACISGSFEETLLYLLQANPNLVHEVTHSDLSRCFHTRVDRCKVWVDDHTFNDYTDKYLYEEVANILEILATYSLTLRSECCLRPICAAATSNDITLLEEMINDGFNFGQPWNTAFCDWKITPLVQAIRNCRPDVVDKLLEAGAQVDDCRYTAFCSGLGAGTALQFASSIGSYGMAYKLLRAGADINARGAVERGRTALSTASANGRLDTAHLLITNSSHRQMLKYECRRAAKHARHTQQYEIAKMLENFVTSLTAELGRDEMDDGIDDVYACYIKSDDGWSRNLMCSKCQHLESTEPRKWLALVLYFGNIVLPYNSGFKLKCSLNGDETLGEIEDLMESTEEEVDTEDTWQLDSDNEKSSQGDGDSNHENENDEPFESWEEFFEFDQSGQYSICMEG